MKSNRVPAVKVLMHLPLYLGTIGLLAAFAGSRGQSQDYWDPEFGNPGIPEGRGGVGSMVWMDNRLFIAGGFYQVAGVAATNVACWDGESWSQLGNGLGVWGPEYTGPNYVEVVRVIDNELYAGGMFDRSGSKPLANLAKWNGHEWVSLGEGRGELPLEGPAEQVAVNDLAGTSEKDIYAVGNFTWAARRPANGIVHWDGTQWQPLGTGVSANPGPAWVNKVALSGSDLYIAGGFDSVDGVPAMQVARWDGSKWGGLGDPGFILTPTALVASHGMIYVGGISQITRWNGTNWFPFGQLDRPPGGDDSVRVIFPVGEELLVGGKFTGIDGLAITNIARWNGREWLPLGGGVHYGAGTAMVGALLATPTEIYVGGYFSTAGEHLSMKIAQWHIPRTLKIRSAQDQVSVSWPAADSNLVLQASSGLPSTNWTPVQATPSVVNGRLTVTNDFGATNQFYRLRGTEE